jgi:hypothetical protein
MKLRRYFQIAIALCVFTTAAVAVSQQQQPAAPRFIPEDHRPALFLRETFNDPPKGLTQEFITPAYINNQKLELKLYGPGKGEVQVVKHDSPKDEPSYIWTGLVEKGNWAVMLREKDNYVDLSGPVAKLRWRTKQAGFHLLRPVLKLADGTMLVGDYAEAYSVDWHESEVPIANIRWRGLDGERVVEATDGKVRENVDLRKVDEIGFTDMSVGAGHGAGGSTRLDWIEVYGNPVKRTGSTN